MNLIFAGRPRDPLIEQLQKRLCTVTVVPLEQLISFLHSDGPALVADGIVASHIMFSAPPHVATPGAFYTYEIRDKFIELPNDLSMPDGRRWKNTPFIVLKDMARRARFEDGTDFHPDTIPYSDEQEAYLKIKSLVSEHRQRLLAELDNLGFVVRYDNGRYLVGPALGEKRVLQEGKLYSVAPYLAAAGRVLTLDRDLYGIEYEVELLEGLLNHKDTAEADLQRFFESHPHFLRPTALFTMLPHVRLQQKAKLLIPDFILKPIVAMQRDSEWEVLDLKRADAKLLVGKANRARLSQEVMNAVTQLRDYGDYFRNPQNADTVAATLGHRLRFPRLAVLVGRLGAADPGALALAQDREPNVRIVTYDEILEKQKQLRTIR